MFEASDKGFVEE